MGEEVEDFFLHLYSGAGEISKKNLFKTYKLKKNNLNYMKGSVKFDTEW